MAERRRSGTLVLALIAAIFVAISAGGVIATVNSQNRATPELTDLAPAIGRLDSLDSSAVPSFLAAEDSEFDANSVRELGESSFGKHWIALSEDRNICVATELASPKANAPSVYASACVPPEMFEEEGVGVNVTGPLNSQSTAYLLPPDVDVSPLAALRTQGTHIEIVMRDPQPFIVADLETARIAEKTELTHADGSPFTLPQLRTR